MSAPDAPLTGTARRIRDALTAARAARGLQHVLEGPLVNAAAVALADYVVCSSYIGQRSGSAFWAELERAYAAARRSAAQLGLVRPGRLRFAALRPRGVDAELLALAGKPHPITEASALREQRPFTKDPR